jgi:UDP-N-acetylglucosamine 2-epimerase (non-hydrolysing)
MAPVIRALQNESWAKVEVLATAQHRELLDQVLDLFDITPSQDLDIMSDEQSLSELTANLLVNTDAYFERAKPDLIIAQGDTTTVLAIALSSFYRKVPFAHVEAGLRTGNFDSPYPEELNRVFASTVARLHFAPTTSARENLLREGFAREKIHVTGNTVIDAMQDISRRNFQIGVPTDENRDLIVVTAHRRESFGTPIVNICQAVKHIADDHPDVQVLWPVHPNPNIGPVVKDMLAGHDRIVLSKPLGYGNFISAMNRARLIITDSGGVQEEACALGIPVLVVREVSDRMEAVEAGASKLVGRSTGAIVSSADQFLAGTKNETTADNAKLIYGDGNAAGRIVEIVKQFLHSGNAN